MLTPVKITTDDARTLAGLLIRPPHGDVKVACVIHSATGVPKEFYIKFASWLAAEKGVATLVYDYRDFGGSLTGKLRDSRATMLDWGMTDQSAALDHLIAAYPNKEIWAIGHSLGGLFLNAHRQSSKVSRAFAVASGPNYWLHNPLSFMPVVLGLWWVIGPLATTIAGFFPGKYVGLGSNLPSGVYWQWRKWCTTREFSRADVSSVLHGQPTHSPANVRIVAMSDDVAITPRMARRLMKNYHDAATIDFREINPRDVGAIKLGHVNVFRERNKRAWNMIIG